MKSLDRALGLFFLVLSIAYGWSAYNFPIPFAGSESVGPSTFPIILAFIIGLSSVYMILKPDKQQEGFEVKAIPELILTLVILVSYIFLMEPLGFITATALMVGMLCWRMGVPPLKAAMTGIASSTVVFLLFHFGLALPLPIGFWGI